MSVELIQVVDVGDLELESAAYDVLATHYEASNGSYHRYYPR